jgi:N-formylglutamate deformylase
MVEPYRFTPGTTPLLVSIPHDGQIVPDDIAARMTETARRIPDTDWHVNVLYDFAAAMGAGVLAATHSRYVVDLNRDPAGEALYPGADNTEIVPLTTFDREPIYLPGQDPDAEAIAARVVAHWRPYHQRLASEVAALRDRFGFAVVFDAHSIRSVVPRFFDGQIPDFNFGTASGASADSELARRAFAVLDGAPGYTAVLDGRFTGGYITRHYGAPADGIHTLQLELSQRTYMNEAYPFDYRADLADRLKPVLRLLLQTVLAWADQGR